jgi:hypothetical protein
MQNMIATCKNSSALKQHLKTIQGTQLNNLIVHTPRHKVYFIDALHLCMFSILIL